MVPRFVSWLLFIRYWKLKKYPILNPQFSISVGEEKRYLERLSIMKRKVDNRAGLKAPPSEGVGRLPFRGAGGGNYHLFFDLDNTLWDFDSNAGMAMLQTVADLGLKDTIADFDAFFKFYQKTNTQLWELYRRKEIPKAILTKRRFEDTLAQFNVNGIDPVAMNLHYMELLPQQKNLCPGVIDTLNYLKRKGYQMSIITNGLADVQRKKISACGLEPYFNRVFISEEIEASKPDKRIFQHALKCCNAKKSKSIMIGDSWETDILGAMAIQMSQVMIAKNGSFIKLPPSEGWDVFDKNCFKKETPRYRTYILRNFNDLLSLL